MVVVVGDARLRLDCCRACFTLLYCNGGASDLGHSLPWLQVLRDALHVRTVQSSTATVAVLLGAMVRPSPPWVLPGQCSCF